MIIEWLKHFGYINDLEASQLKASVAGLKSLLEGVKGHLSLPPDTTPEQLLEAPRCGCPDVLPIGVEQAKWRKRDLTYRVRSYLPTSLVAQSVQDDVFAAGTKDWSDKLDITFRRVAMDSPADITIFASRIDGPGRVLAQAQLADGRDSPLWLQFDDGEQAWSTLKGSREANLHNVFRHELGHNLGHYHNQKPQALMYAMANSNIPFVTELDVLASLQLGYSRRVDPAPVPVPIPPTPGGGGMNDFVKTVLEFLGWGDASWSERVALIRKVLGFFEEFFKGREAPAPTALAEMTTDQLVASIKEQLPTVDEGADVQPIGDWAKSLWPLILELIRRRLAGM